jgi:aconitase B
LERIRKRLIRDLRNFLNLSSAEVAAIAAKLGRIPTVEEYLSAMQGIEPTIFGKNQKRPIRNLHNFLNF